MSEAWFYWCRVCDACCEQSINHGEKKLTRLLNTLPAINLLRSVNDDIEIGYLWGGTEIVNWLLEHYGHDIVLRNEYSKFIDSDGNEREVGK